MKVPDISVMISVSEMQAEFTRILSANGFSEHRAVQCAEIFTQSSIDGVYTHGVNRFPRFVEYIKKGFVKPSAIPSLKSKTGAIEQWDGNLGPGPLNAVVATERAMQLSSEFGIGCVGLSNTNHWMRGGTYGWQAAKAGFAFVGFTNTIANMPAWGAINKKLGNNPLVIGIPYEGEAIVLDMAMSQYSVGAMEMAAMQYETLAVPGGFDENGRLSSDPAVVMNSNRPLAIGYWKGAGLALLLDMLTVILSGGLATYEIGKNNAEYGLSQVFISVDISKIENSSTLPGLLRGIIRDYTESSMAVESAKAIYPGEKVLQTRNRNVLHGIPVLKKVWEEVVKL